MRGAVAWSWYLKMKSNFREMEWNGMEINGWMDRHDNDGSRYNCYNYNDNDNF